MVIAVVISSDGGILEQGGLLTQYDWCPYKRWSREDKETHREKDVTMKAEAAVMQLQPANQHKRGQSKEGIPYRSQREHGPADNLIVDF